ncbi:hypothetical protein FHS78_001832 [Parvibaculum indicum]|uniref:phage holin family protein n=1 Tax=Parvibaculum indicum TaxID=562969 RepID=UPI00141DB35B|nr:phage holin family protein [Parvibaculum indicum]NIJ41542.1 hypothetical protein [Parvibaculum indicum]
MYDPTPKLRTLAEAELFRAELEAKRLANRLSLVGIAVFLAIFAFTMLVIAGFLALSELYGYPLGALITGGALLFVAIVALGLAARKPSHADELEMKLANLNIEAARADIRRDVDALEKRFNDLSMGLLGMVRGTSSGMPMVTIILGALAAMSPFLRKIIMPILNRDGGARDDDAKPE